MNECSKVILVFVLYLNTYLQFIICKVDTTKRNLCGDWKVYMNDDVEVLLWPFFGSRVSRGANQELKKYCSFEKFRAFFFEHFINQNDTTIDNRFYQGPLQRWKVFSTLQ